MSMRFFVVLLSLFFVLFPMPAAAHGDEAVRFATLPKPGPGFPEGIAADAAGRIYVSTFDFTTTNVIHVFEPNGSLAATISLPGVVPLGMEFDRKGDLYVANFGGGTILRFRPPFNSGSVPADTFQVCGGAGAGCGLNAITFDNRGDLYVSDSFGGKVFKVALPQGRVTTFASHDLLSPGSHGFPPFGANGLAFDAAFANLYVANTADDRILKVDVRTKAVSTFTESINGADGIAFDAQGRLWVAANQGDELVALNANGRIVERRGSFIGIGSDGAPQGLLFPASIVIRGGNIYVTNLALALTPAVGDEPEEDVTTYTVSRVPLD
jgi:sugar lactone lactonase YvrE